MKWASAGASSAIKHADLNYVNMKNFFHDSLKSDEG